MKRFIASATAAVAFLASTPAFAADIITVDSWTNTTDRYISGQLESRLQELGTNAQSGIFNQIVRDRLEAGIQLHCARTLDARKAPANEKCGSATSYVSIRPSRN